MAVKITKPAINLRSQLSAPKAGGAAADQDFWFNGDSTTTAFSLSRGWKPKRVFVNGEINRPGDDWDYTISFDGFTYTVSFAVAPSTVSICITGELA